MNLKATLPIYISFKNIHIHQSQCVTARNSQVISLIPHFPNCGFPLNTLKKRKDKCFCILNYTQVWWVSFIFKEHSSFFLLNKKEKQVCEFFKTTLLFQTSLTGKGAQKNFYLKWGTIHKGIHILLGCSKKPSELLAKSVFNLHY